MGKVYQPESLSIEILTFCEGNVYSRHFGDIAAESRSVLWPAQRFTGSDRVK